MTKEELTKLSRENLRKSKQGSLCECYDEAFIKGYELSEKRIAELEEKISNLLSCKNCPENKGGFICVKEYENKCLAQNLEDTEILNKTYEKRFSDLEKENAELKKQLEMSNKVYNDNLDYSHHIEGQLTTAKEIISEYINILKGDTKNWKKTQEKAELFLKGE